MEKTPKINLKKARKNLPILCKLLREHYPDAQCALMYSNPLELMVATILSAQCTDVMVNKVTPALFKKYRNAKDFADAKIEELQTAIRSTGFYRNKAKNIQNACKLLVEKFGGVVPQTMEELLMLPGVARKTANVVLFNAYGVQVGITVDTHVTRLSRRLGLTKEKQPEKIEKDLMTIVAPPDWGMFSHYLIAHGRKLCKAQRPLCEDCFLNKLCPSAFGF